MRPKDMVLWTTKKHPNLTLFFDGDCCTMRSPQKRHVGQVLTIYNGKNGSNRPRTYGTAFLRWTTKMTWYVTRRVSQINHRSYRRSAGSTVYSQLCPCNHGRNHLKVTCSERSISSRKELATERLLFRVIRLLGDTQLTWMAHNHLKSMRRW